MSYRVGVDIGGTFTDFTIIDGEGKIYAHKVPSTPKDLSVGVVQGLDDIAKLFAISGEEFLSQVDLFLHGTTVATNTVIQRRGAKTGLMTTKGFEAILYMRDGQKDQLFNQRIPVPEPYVERYLTFGIEERINYAGEVITPLNEEDVLAAIRQMREWNIKAVGVCLLWSFINPVHERKIAEILAKEWPEVAVSISCEVQATMGEWPRTCATVLNASLIPVMTEYIRQLQDSLRHKRYKRDLLIVKSTAGVVPSAAAARNPVFTLISGPSMGPIAALFYGEIQGTKDVILIDMGGTSFDVSMVSGGMLKMTKDARVADIPTGVPSAEVTTLGAGGGSIGWLDPGKMLRVGPQSAGADPGPACYGRGGDQPTVTDANVVLGYLNPDYFLGGRIPLDPKLSEKVIMDKIGNPLGLDTVAAANAIFTIVNQNMVAGMEGISIRRGIDPRKYLLVAAGGATATHAGKLAEAMQMKRIIVPRLAGEFCALGMLISDIKYEYVAPFFTLSDDFGLDKVNQIYNDLEAQSVKELVGEGVLRENIKLERWVEARYVGQIWEIMIPVPGGKLTKDDVLTIVNRFHDAHKELYTYNQPGMPVEFITWRLTGLGLVPKISFSEQPYDGEDSSAAKKGKRMVYFEEEKGTVKTPIYDGTKLVNGMKLKGPAVIEIPTTTIVVFPKWQATVTKNGDYYMEML